MSLQVADVELEHRRLGGVGGRQLGVEPGGLEAGIVQAGHRLRVGGLDLARRALQGRRLVAHEGVDRLGQDLGQPLVLVLDAGVLLGEEGRDSLRPVEQERADSDQQEADAHVPAKRVRPAHA